MQSKLSAAGPRRTNHAQLLLRQFAVALCAVLLAAAAGLSQANASSGKPEFDACFDRHGRTQGISPDLLRAIAHTESAMRPGAMNLSHQANTGSVDIGLMQINSRWLPALARYGIHRSDLDDPCTNIEVGAWILADLVRTKGDTWDAVGAWNAACTQLRGDACQAARARFAWRVYRNAQRVALKGPPKPTPPAERAPPAVRPGLLRLVLNGVPADAARGASSSNAATAPAADLAGALFAPPGAQPDTQEISP